MFNRKFAKFMYHLLNGVMWLIAGVLGLATICGFAVLPAYIGIMAGMSFKNAVIMNVVIIASIATIAFLMHIYELGEKYVKEDNVKEDSVSNA